MNKSELIDAMAQDAGITKVAAKAALESFMSNVQSTLQQKDGKVSLVGFGTFSVAERAARQESILLLKNQLKLLLRKWLNSSRAQIYPMLLQVRVLRKNNFQIF